MEPAASIIQKLGGERAVADLTGTAYTAPYRWQHAVDKGGTGGRIPAKHIPIMIEHAAKIGIPLAHADFFAAPAPERVP